MTYNISSTIFLPGGGPGVKPAGAMPGGGTAKGGPAIGTPILGGGTVISVGGTKNEIEIIKSNIRCQKTISKSILYNTAIHIQKLNAKTCHTYSERVIYYILKYMYIQFVELQQSHVSGHYQPTAKAANSFCVYYIKLKQFY